MEELMSTSAPEGEVGNGSSISWSESGGPQQQQLLMTMSDVQVQLVNCPPFNNNNTNGQQMALFDEEKQFQEITKPIKRVLNLPKLFPGGRRSDGSYKMRVLRGRGRPPKHRQLSDDESLLGASDGGQDSDGSLDRFKKSKSLPNSPEVVNWLKMNYEPWDGTTVPRATIYFHYRLFCEEHGFQMLNQASFGKAIRMVFPVLQTRRLGSRGNSKYHYDGIRIKEDSKYFMITCDAEANDERYEIFSDLIRSKSKRPKTINLKSFFPKKKIESSSGFNCQWSLADLKTCFTPVQLDNFPVIEVLTPKSDPSSNQLQFEDNYLEFLLFETIYKEHWRLLFEQLNDLNLTEYEMILSCFWRSENMYDFIDPPKDVNYYDETLTRDKMEELVEQRAIQKFIQKVDLYCYQAIVDLFYADIKSPPPEIFNEIFNKFAGFFGVKLHLCLKDYPSGLIDLKMNTFSLFRNSINFYSHVSHLVRIEQNFFRTLEVDLSFGPLLVRALSRLNFNNFASEYFEGESELKRDSWKSFELFVLFSFTTQVTTFSQWTLQLQVLFQSMFQDNVQETNQDHLEGKIKGFFRFWKLLLEKLKRLIFNHCPENLRLYYYFFDFMREFAKYYTHLQMAQNSGVYPILYSGADLGQPLDHEDQEEGDQVEPWLKNLRQMCSGLSTTSIKLVQETQDEIKRYKNAAKNNTTATTTPSNSQQNQQQQQQLVPPQEEQQQQFEMTATLTTIP